jgi:nitrogenase-associated protein
MNGAKAVEIIFYEKRGCMTNAKQRRFLEAAGHRVIRRDLSAEPWTAGRLHEFFKDAPISDWFNRASPRVKSGEIDLQQLTAAAALSLLVEDPLLIKRPLIEIGPVLIAGFDPGRLQACIDLQPPDAQFNLQACSRHPHEPR